MFRRKVELIVVGSLRGTCLQLVKKSRRLVKKSSALGLLTLSWQDALGPIQKELESCSSVQQRMFRLESWWWLTRRT